MQTISIGVPPLICRQRGPSACMILILSQIQNDYIIANNTTCNGMGAPIHLADPHNISLFFIHNSKKNTLNRRKIYILCNYLFILCIISHKPDRFRSGSALFSIFHQIHIHLTCRYYAPSILMKF